MTNKRKAMGAAVVAAAVALSAPASQAGGLFGEGGLIRGSIGKALDTYVEQPILTPLAQFAVVGAGATVGAVAGGLAGLPELGALLGAAAGDAVNGIAAGE